MATFGEHASHERDRVERIKEGILSGGSLALAIGGAATLVLTIIGLSTLDESSWPVWMLRIATIVVGAAFLLEGVSLAGRQIQLMSRTGGTIEQTELLGGLSAEFLAGCVGLALGIIALFGIYPEILCASAVILFGSALVFGGQVRAYLGGREAYRSDVARTDLPRTDLGAAPMERQPLEQLSTLLSPAYGSHVMIGLAVMAIGIVALSTDYTLTLSLVGLLTAGFVLFLSGTAVASRLMYKMVRQQRV